MRSDVDSRQASNWGRRCDQRKDTIIDVVACFASYIAANSTGDEVILGVNTFLPGRAATETETKACGWWMAAAVSGLLDTT